MPSGGAAYHQSNASLITAGKELIHFCHCAKGDHHPFLFWCQQGSVCPTNTVPPMNMQAQKSNYLVTLPDEVDLRKCMMS